MTVKLTDEQRRAVEIVGSSLLIVAGAGTGKTYVLIEKIAHLLRQGIPGHNILALTFTNKAADEMRNRLTTSLSAPVHSLFVGTFHSFCFSLLREFSLEAGLPTPFVIFDREACKRVIKRCMKNENITSVTPRVMQYAIGRLKTGLAADMEESVVNEATTILPLYTLAMREESALDFNDLILATIALLEKNHTVRDTVNSRYTYILVDEFQDTDALQNKLISLLKGPASYLIAVGDTDQTIYSWRGASVHTMLGFTEQYAPAEIVFLTKNYRSSGSILAAANTVISKNVFRPDRELVPTRHTGCPISSIPAYDEEDEAHKIVQKIQSIHTSGVAYQDIAVLFRANFQARALETHMVLNHVPYTVLGSRFFDRLEIKGLLAYLLLLQNPNSREAFARASQVPRRRIGPRTLEKIFAEEEHSLPSATKERVAELRSDIQNITRLAEKNPVGYVLREMLQILNYKKHLEAVFDNPEERMREVQELIAFADRFSHISGREGVEKILSDFALSGDQDTLRTDRKNSVRLMTVHAAKGLEFSHVFISGMEEGLFPFLHDTYETHDAEEERRLCYVAMTRAKDGLYCSFAERRGFFGSYRRMRPSSFLDDIPKDLLITLDSKHGSDASPRYSASDEEEVIDW